VDRKEIVITGGAVDVMIRLVTKPPLNIAFNLREIKTDFINFFFKKLDTGNKLYSS
jgi:hypothetical protein